MVFTVKGSGIFGKPGLVPTTFANEHTFPAGVSAGWLLQLLSTSLLPFFRSSAFFYLSLSPLLPFSLSDSFSVSFSLSLFHSLFLVLFCLSLALFLSLSLSLFLSLSLPLASLSFPISGLFFLEILEVHCL